MKMYLTEKQIGDQGELLVARLFIKYFHWICRLQDVDIGIDAEYEPVDANCQASGKIAKIQVKATSKAFNKGANDFYINQHDLHYWQNCSVPVVFCYVSLVTDEVLWLCVEPASPYETRGAGHKFTLQYPGDLLRPGSKVDLLEIANRSTSVFYQALLAGEKLADRLVKDSPARWAWDASEVNWLDQLRSRINEIDQCCTNDPYIRKNASLNDRIGQLEAKFYRASRALDDTHRAY